MTKRIFYVIYIDDEPIQSRLDAMRFLANTEEKAQAHITVRGPYTQKQNVSRLNREVAGTKIVAKGIGTFFNSKQNTVFIRCYADSLRRIWQKSDFGFNPHITIYDGPSREFAGALVDHLSRVQIQFSFLVDKLFPMTSHKGQFAIWLKERFDQNVFVNAPNVEVLASDVRLLPDKVRLSYIELLARELDAIREKRFLYGEQGGHCNGCRLHLQIDDLEVDHILPIQLGGADHANNRQLLCKPCRKFKRESSQAELFAARKESRLSFTPLGQRG